MATTSSNVNTEIDDNSRGFSLSTSVRSRTITQDGNATTETNRDSPKPPVMSKGTHGSCIMYVCMYVHYV